MTRPRIRAALLATGAGLATAYASVSDFTGVIHGYYTLTGAAGLPAAGRQDAMGHRAVSPPSAGTGKPGRPRMTTLFTRCCRRAAAGQWPYRPGVRPARVSAGRSGGAGDD
jgi:hypothetical protein